MDENPLIYAKSFPLVSSTEDPKTEEACASYLKALGDPMRLKIVRELTGGALSVSDVCLMMDAPIAVVSHHLRVLYHAGIVSTERDGKFIYYQLNAKFLKNNRSATTFDFGCCKFQLKEDSQ